SVGLQIELTILELGFDGLGELFVADQALNLFHDFSVAGNEEARGVAEKTAELVGDLVVADDDGVVHGQFQAVDVEAFLGQKRIDGGFAFFIHGDAQNGETLRFVLLLHFDEPGNFDVAGIAPGGPEIDQDNFSFVLGKRGISTVEIFEGDFGSALAIGRVVGLRGALYRAYGLHARGLVGKISRDDEHKHGRDDRTIFFIIVFLRLLGKILLN